MRSPHLTCRTFERQAESFQAGRVRRCQFLNKVWASVTILRPTCAHKVKSAAFRAPKRLPLPLSVPFPNLSSLAELFRRAQQVAQASRARTDFDFYHDCRSILHWRYTSAPVSTTLERISARLWTPHASLFAEFSTKRRERGLWALHTSVIATK